MKNTNEKKMNNVIRSKEVIMVDRIADLYNQMIGTGTHDRDYRRKLIQELLKLQKEDGSFSVIDNYKCEVDIRVEYLYIPTYYGTAAMIYAVNYDGEDDTVKTALEKGLKVAMERHLVGHGYDATRQQLEALNIYKKADLYDFLQNYGKEYDGFNEIIKTIIDKYRTNLAENRTISDWMVDFRSEFENEVIEYDMNMVRTLWYASYGSNISRDRFMEYIKRCSDTSEPVESKAITIPHNIYFSSRSSIWGGKGTAFLDDTCPGMALGRMYLITSQQFIQIQEYEGAKYSKKVQIGTEDGLPVYTFTAPEKRTDIKSPSITYFNTIMKGLKETYTDYSETSLLVYLFDSGIIDEQDRRILSFIRNSEHGVTLQTIADHTVGLTKTRKSIKKLVDLKFLKQDRRSIAAGHTLTSNEAVFYTSKERREVITLLLFMNR